MKRWIKSVLCEISFGVKVYSDEIEASKSSTDNLEFDNFINRCIDILENDYGFNLIENESSNRIGSLSRYLRFQASDSKNGIIIVNVYFQLRISDHVSNLQQAKIDYSRSNDISEYNKLTKALISYNNFHNEKDNELKVNKHVDLPDIIIENFDYDLGEKIFRKRLGLAMKTVSKYK